MIFSNLKREEWLDSLQAEEFDLLIIGGGITGAGIALDAAARGIKTAVIDMQDFAAGTSSRSTKLVHGGLRYLKQLEIGVVAEVGKERAIVYENGPHVTTPEWMLLPMHEGGTFGKFTTEIGLRVYDFLAGVKKTERRKMLTVEETLRKEPLIKREGLVGGGYYVEYRTDDARLTIEVMKKAVERGAAAVNYVKAETFTYENGKVTGLQAKDLLTDQQLEIKAKIIVNAAGPWVDEVRKQDYSINNKYLKLTKGVHIVIDQSKFPLKQAVYFDSPDGRMIFAIPRDGKTYVGTTDTFYDKEIAQPKMLAADRDYLLEAIHYMFPDVQIYDEDVESSWAGVRPLIYEEGKDPSEISRKDEIWEGASGLITIAGGKLTGYRRMAETVVDRVSTRLSSQTGETYEKCQTKHLPVSGGDIGGAAQLRSFIEQKGEEAVASGFSKQEGEYLAGMYGSNVDQVFACTQDTDQTDLPRVMYAQLQYAVHHEMVWKPADFFIRRTGKLFFQIHEVKKYKEQVAAAMAEWFSWSSSMTQLYLAELNEEISVAHRPIDSRQ
ncbi:glycerol-3-phosphate dehydrogenase/oxidase [Pseudobacillus wudalianchiensis]|uniref:Glycerol-3-phosphate dehydrogenase n=1 Tax=Pseudobacillus wudalianchiensis TaxID=1743143 RepID=A0A1B9AIU6_9BACI|nr:FAD-dependent oxidoreductase [Bacillus wudalianchiensis]OCA83762.1 glycerol-3-phosphate dehydrogenase [Bacillus wudalianchiensis]